MKWVVGKWLLCWNLNQELVKFPELVALHKVVILVSPLMCPRTITYKRQDIHDHNLVLGTLWA